MAIQISGTTVVNNSRQLQNIASLDSTTTSTIAAAAGGVTVVKSGFSTATTALTLQYSHGQGSTPDFVYGELEITTAQHGFAVGDQIKITNLFERDEDDRMLTFWGNSTTIGYAMNAGVMLTEIAHRNTGSDLRLTGQKVRVVGVWFS